jgi:AraC-like DNA-binding protein
MAVWQVESLPGQDNSYFDSFWAKSHRHTRQDPIQNRHQLNYYRVLTHLMDSRFMTVSERKELTEADIRGENCKTLSVRADGGDPRAWLAIAPICEQLSQYHILHAGVASMPAPFRIVRTNLAGSYFLASLSGEGRVLVDGKWVASRPGHAFLLPPKTMHAFYTPAGKCWEFCWVRYQEAVGQVPIARANSPVVARFDGRALEHSIRGLYHEARAFDVAPYQDHWIRIIHNYVQRFAAPVGVDTRLWRTWEKVALQLDYPWTITDLAKESYLSEKQFQRLCRMELGRSPQQQLMWLRMRRAAELLAEEDRKINSIANAVGYQNPFVFSSTFKRMMGWSPSEYAKMKANK